jgi:hypothetical protein
METPISHLTHRAITDHLAIVRNDIDRIERDILDQQRIPRELLKQTRENVRKGIIATLSYAQLIADLRRQVGINGK